MKTNLELQAREALDKIKAATGFDLETEQPLVQRRNSEREHAHRTADLLRLIVNTQPSIQDIEAEAAIILDEIEADSIVK